MKISEEEVKHIAQLAKLSFTEKEIIEFTKKFGHIVQFFNPANESETEYELMDIEMVKEKNEYRKDIVLSENNQEKLFRNTKNMENGLIKIPKIIEDE
ncbi:Asp-tRNA(Asn)/Glu-tRNA(Gln) amidotransferase subunit GatC [Serpentinicella sp. ANB-PHB4]|uniref:Asp-tRNA(Asn)/Glu-tRNA(Gln) amidotransferase subunit GatC n=1 Tax=Serpentinicella sp. ANB-PHB4 TaxID=3074076 RepID=UPI0028560FEB|nr:Asp-tRNA(Asn)/Glu-tRNA(Gln) amidotransferase subunit GatC [Serpentinicella sp. ANB-PHB4]MDR5658083.1 Asp-tRNA(Asn)/Glu-tRNA(Gln) amidotransferase subunit GatC [Serpentinicella sp. ANB-PHB4]